MITVLIVDDHRVVADTLCDYIKKEKGITVLGKAYSITECREMLKTINPDVILLDVNLPDGNGIDLCPEILKHYPETKILMLTSFESPNVIGRALDEGAHGYILKNSQSEEVIKGIRAVFSGKKNYLCSESKTAFNKEEYRPVFISSKEREVLKLIVDGLTIKEIAEKMFLSFETIRGYHKYLHLKLGVHNVAALVRVAIEQKLV